ncbi:M23 family metallopeptidase [Sediminicola luteus]|uniref:Peptidase M23 n=1 Tax=Sediminicola luteus TaxID=319238 RepID=A0A2A4G8Y7_9FLAO|nr:M23 family metallopeptidase [Sediminicola luteus]PCE64881.1 peptidase M23 [Sediminicola luteus]
MKRTIAILTFFCLTFGLQGQAPHDSTAFRSPVDIPIILAGSFGELRSNHFHAGIDIKTQQREGLPIKAIGKGSVSRIKVSHWGYGKALYIKHPNGYTSVYGHLQKFSPEIEAYVKARQYQKKSYQIELFPDLGELQVEQGELVAISGNSGSSAGPHLHFEIRSSANEKPINPLLFGMEVRDATDPVLLNLYAYPLGKNAQIKQSGKRIPISFRKSPEGHFIAEEITASGLIGFGFNGFDRQDLAANKNGIYRVRQVVDGKTITDYSFDTFSFTETRNINAFIDYEHFSKTKQRVQLGFRDKGNRLGIYRTLVNDGKIDIKPGQTYSIEFLLNDLHGNLTKLIIPVSGKADPIKIEKTEKQSPHFVLAQKPAQFNLDNTRLYFPANTFYKNTYLDLESGMDTIKIHDGSVPVNRNFTLSFNVDHYDTETRKQLLIARLDKRGRPNYSTTYKKGNVFTTRTKNLGTYTLVSDSVAPVIKPKNFRPKSWLNNYKYLSVRILDNLSGIGSYSAKINGQWILMEYEPKKNTLTYDFSDTDFSNTQLNLEIEVTDNVGNRNQYKTTVFRK